MNNQPTDLASFPVTSFYYTDVIGDLVVGFAANAVSDGRHKKPLQQGAFVLNYAHTDGRYYAQVGVATGEVTDFTADSLWTSWTKQSLVHTVHWLTGQVEVPTELLTNQRQTLPLDDVREVITYVLMN